MATARPAPDAPLGKRLTDGAQFMRVIAERMDKLAEDVDRLQRQASINESQAVFDARREQIDAELARDAALEETAILLDDLDAMRLELLTPEEVIERRDRREWGE